MKKLNVAILGQGRSGYSIHGRYLLTDKERFQVVVIVDKLPERRVKAERIFGCQTFSTYQELYGRTDIDQMAQAAQESGKMLAFFQQSRLAPYFMKIQEVIASGKLGRLIQISIAFDGFSRRWDWQTIQENVAGSLYNTGPHPMDQAIVLLDYDQGMPDVFCKMDRLNSYGDAEDYV